MQRAIIALFTLHEMQVRHSTKELVYFSAFYSSRSELLIHNTTAIRPGD